jgi:hypothetical protein
VTLASAGELLGACERSAVHLELRDGYSRADPLFQRWQAARMFSPGCRGWRSTATKHRRSSAGRFASSPENGVQVRAWLLPLRPGRP